VVAVDTSSERASVAVVQAGEVRGEVRLDTQVPSVAVLPAVEFLLRSLGLTPSDVDGYAVTLGPGSFTGVRVGLSTVQGLALASGRPCVGLSTLDVVASLIAGQADTLVALIDAFRDEVFVRRYDRGARPLGPPSREAPEAALAGLAGTCAIAGDGARKYAALVQRLLPDAHVGERAPYLAAALGLRAEPLLVAGEGVEAGALRPQYLRDADVRRSKP
jgi:tRNA threonylcarbamoyladenosine biosynthesis protein TsaB